jgi:hypothetical protein
MKAAFNRGLPCRAFPHRRALWLGLMCQGGGSGEQYQGSVLPTGGTASSLSIATGLSRSVILS